MAIPGYEMPVLTLSDHQIGEESSIDETFGINHYNLEVYRQRLEHLDDRVLNILTEHQNAEFRRRVVASLRDNVSGVMHDELQTFGH